MTPLQVEIVVINGLKLAARQFEAMAKNAAHPKRLREQFITQASDALRVVELIEVETFIITEKRSALEEASCHDGGGIPARSDSNALTPTALCSQRDHDDFNYCWSCKTTREQRSAVSSGPTTGEHVSDVNAQKASRDSPAVAGNGGGIFFPGITHSPETYFNGIPLFDVILDAVHEWECANGFVHPIGVPCNGECAP